jgi:enterochelin esterase family protein
MAVHISGFSGRHLPESDLFYQRVAFESDARLDYKNNVNSKDILDPLNKATAPSGHGENSELSMPDFTPAEELKESRNIPKGKLNTVTHSSQVLGYDHTLFVYTPAAIDTSKAPLRVVYFQDGADYVNFAFAPRVLDNMIAAKSLPPLLAVFIAPPTEKKRNRITEFGMNEEYAKYFVSELIPFIDQKYNTLRRSIDRLVVGPSFGGLISLYIAFSYSDSIANVASQSGYVSFMGDSLLELYRKSPRKLLRIYTDVGTYERNIGGMTPGSSDGDFLGGNRRLSRILNQKAYTYLYREFHDGHSWGRWRNELPFILRWFFPVQKE